MSRLLNKTVLVTGASKGIGREIAIGCAREGANVIVNYRSDRAGAQKTARTITNLGRQAVVLQADVGRPAQIDRLFVRARKVFPQLDVLINNAALTGWGGVSDTSEKTWDRVFATNLKGVFFCSAAAAAWMRETGTAGAIVNVSSNCAALGVKNLVAYATSKAGLHGLTTQLAVDLAPDGIRVNTFAPGPTNVDRNLADDPNYRKVWGGVVPLGRTAEAGEMVGPAVFLAGNESSYLTGQVFYADGGWSIQGRIPENNLNQAARQHR